MRKNQSSSLNIPIFSENLNTSTLIGVGSKTVYDLGFTQKKGALAEKYWF
jgi:hypothetical protein